jgi:hypothetical protein
MRRELVTTFSLLLLLLLGACAPAQPSGAESRTVSADPDQVQFFERPLTLAAMRKANEPVPIVVLLENDPWAMVIGSDSPSFALYEDGTIIQRTATGFGTTRLTGAELESFIKGLNLDAIAPLYGGYEAEDATDQPTQDLLIYRGEKPVFVSVYGSLKRPEVRSKIPNAIVAVYDRLSEFEYSPSRDWLPEDIEVMIWPFENARGPSVPWPEQWPGLDDPNTVRRGDSFSIFMPSTRLAELRAFLELRDSQAIELDGRKWAASIRFPFPQEDLWMAPNPEVKRSES